MISKVFNFWKWEVGSRGAGEQRSRGAGEQGSRGAGEQRSREAEEQGRIINPQSLNAQCPIPHSPSTKRFIYANLCLLG
ncbi:hypothetical protein [Nostoc sp.]|uniref:hypothetical protein n=1 Tax=Nostoc sp. TaxID=1180 RepID=UPI002FF84A5A